MNLVEFRSKKGNRNSREDVRKKIFSGVYWKIFNNKEIFL